MPFRGTELEQLHREVKEARVQVGRGLPGATGRLNEALARKEAWLRAHDDELGRALDALDAEETTLSAEARAVATTLDTACAASEALVALRAPGDPDAHRDHARAVLARLTSQCAYLGVSFAYPHDRFDDAGRRVDQVLALLHARAQRTRRRLALVRDERRHIVEG